jgi:hypothetical protein
MPALDEPSTHGVLYRPFDELKASLRTAQQLAIHLQTLDPCLKATPQSCIRDPTKAAKHHLGIPESSFPYPKSMVENHGVLTPSHVTELVSPSSHSAEHFGSGGPCVR